MWKCSLLPLVDTAFDGGQKGLNKKLRRTKNLMNYIPVYKSLKLELLPVFLYL